MKFSLLFITLLWGLSTAKLVELKNSSHFESFAESSKWIVEFYAPWCNHCQKLAPILEKLSDYSDGHVAVGKLDATKIREVADKFAVTRFPTLYFKHHGVIGKYDGGRDFASLSRFVDNLDRESISEVDDESAVGTHFVSSGFNVSYVLNFPSKCLSPNSCSLTYSEIESVADNLKFHHSILKWKNSRGNELSLCKYGKRLDGKEAELLMCSSANDVSSIENLESFVRLNNFPLVSEFEAHNFKVLAHLNKTMVIFVVDFRDGKSLQFSKQALNTVAHAHKHHDPTSIIFGFLDGIRWKKFARHHEAAVPSILVADHDNERHAVFSLKKMKGDDYESVLLDVLDKLRAGAIEMKSTTVSPSLLQKVLHRIERYGWLSLLLFLSPIVFLASSFFFPHPKDKKSKQQ